MSCLLVTEFGRTYGEFRRGWVRALHRRYVARYRAIVARAAARLAATDELTILTARGLVDESTLPAGVRVRYHDEETYRVDSLELAPLARHVASAWCRDIDDAALTYRGVRLPDVLSTSLGIRLRLEVLDPLGIVDNVFNETKPERVVLLTGASVPERLARLVARRAGLPVGVVAPGFVRARLAAAATGALARREERRRLRGMIELERRPVVARPPVAERALFVSTRARHHFVIDPVMAELRAAGVESLVIAPPTTDAALAAHLDKLAADGVPGGYLTDYLPRDDARALVRRHGPALRRVWRRLADGRLAASLTWRGLRLEPVLRPWLRNNVELGLLTGLLCVEAAFRLVDAARPTAAIVTSDRRHAERAVALVARQAGIPCVFFSGALILGRDRTNAHDIGDRILVIGEHLRAGLIAEERLDPRRVAVVGDPRSSAARRVSRDDLRAAIRRDLGLGGDRPLLVVVSKYVSLLFSADEKAAFYRTIAGAVPRLGGIDVVVKVHPNEDLATLRPQIAGWGLPNATVTQSYDIHRLFRAADAAVMVTSMAGLEAMAMGCPVVAVQTRGKDFDGDYMVRYVKDGVAERVDAGDSDALARTLARLLTDEAARTAHVGRARAFASAYVGPTDGNFAERLLAVITETRAEIGARRTA